LARYAGTHMADADFKRERRLGNGLLGNTKEDLMYYRIFREHFGDFADLSWMGRTEGAPQA
jgi:asparagine synthase (glutamine-hydrolysing)